jgi:type I restriction enzyme S subunit
MLNYAKNWELSKIGECLMLIRGISFPKSAKKIDYKGGLIACLRTKNVQKEVDWDDLWFVDSTFLKRKEQIIKKGDILISVSNSLKLLGKVSLIKSIPYVSTLGAFIVNLRVPESLNNKFIFYYLSSLDFKNNVIEKASTTTNISNISAGKLANIFIPIAPLNEQNRIVEKIEGLFSDLDKATEDLKKTREKLKIYRKAVLKAAFEGKLTEEWRKKNISRLAEEVLKIKNENIDELFKVPKSWKWLKILHIGEVETGTTPRKNVKSNYGDDYPFYKPTDLETGINVRNAREYLSVKGLKKARFLPKNSILVTCIGATIGKTGIIRLPGASNQQINAIIPYKFTNPDFIYYQVISPYFQEQIISKSSSTTLPILNKSRFKELLIVMATREEQEQILQEIESRLSVCDKVEKTVEQNLNKIEYLRQSILKKAFEGKLVSQDPNDLPAGELLKQIKIKKNKMSKNGK